MSANVCTRLPSARHSIANESHRAEPRLCTGHAFDLVHIGTARPLAGHPRRSFRCRKTTRQDVPGAGNRAACIKQASPYPCNAFTAARGSCWKMRSSARAGPAPISRSVGGSIVPVGDNRFPNWVKGLFLLLRFSVGHVMGLHGFRCTILNVADLARCTYDELYCISRPEQAPVWKLNRLQPQVVLALVAAQTYADAPRVDAKHFGQHFC